MPNTVETTIFNPFDALCMQSVWTAERAYYPVLPVAMLVTIYSLDMAFHHPSMEALNFSKALSHYIGTCHFLVLMGYAGLHNHLHQAFVSNAFHIYCGDLPIHMNRTTQATCKKARVWIYLPAILNYYRSKKSHHWHMQSMKCNTFPDIQQIYSMPEL